MASDSRLGKVIGGRFRLTSRIGEGGMGVVYLAEDSETSGRAAVKYLHESLLTNEEFVARFRQEAKSASRLDYEGVVRVLAAGNDEDDVPYIAMEYCAGPSLQAVIRDEAPFTISRACELTRQILLALSQAHKNGIVHRDLKPENVKVESDASGRETVKILDFGVAKFVGTDEIKEMTGAVKTKTGVVFGTPKYMAPEQILGQAVDARADIYSAGSIFYEMLTGTPPFSSDDIIGFVTRHLKEPVVPPGRRVPSRNIPPKLDEVVLSMLEKDRNKRPARAADVAAALEAFVGGRAGADLAGGGKLTALFPFLGGAVGAIAAALLAPSHAVAAAGAGAGLGVGAGLAFLLFPHPGEKAYWIRTSIVGLCLAAAAAITGFVGAGAFLPASLALGSLLVFVLYSLGWGRRNRLVAFLLGGILAPVAAVPLLPFPAGKSYDRLWDLPKLGAAALAPALVLLVIALAFAASSFLVPLEKEADSRQR